MVCKGNKHIPMSLKIKTRPVDKSSGSGRDQMSVRYFREDVDGRDYLQIDMRVTEQFTSVIDFMLFREIANKLEMNQVLIKLTHKGLSCEMSPRSFVNAKATLINEEVITEIPGKKSHYLINPYFLFKGDFNNAYKVDQIYNDMVKLDIDVDPMKWFSDGNIESFQKKNEPTKPNRKVYNQLLERLNSSSH